MSTDQWTVTFQAAPDSVPAIVRLRRLLKFAWRVLRLRVVTLEGERTSAAGLARRSRR
jgi:hypothetical protein